MQESTCLSSFLRPAQRAVMLMLHINLSGGAHFVDDF